MLINEVFNLFKLHSDPESLSHQELRNHSDIMRPSEFYGSIVGGKIRSLLHEKENTIIRIQDTNAYPITITARYIARPELFRVLLGYFGHATEKQVFEIIQPGYEEVKYKLYYTVVNRQWPVVMVSIMLLDRKLFSCADRSFYTSIPNYWDLNDEFVDIRK